jgi:nitroreductase
VDFQEVVLRRRMVRSYDTNRPVPADLVDRIVRNGLRAPSPGWEACFFGIPVERIDAYRAAFGVPAQFTPIGAISIGYIDDPPRDLSGRRKPAAETVHRSRWNRPAR